jgi:hypothetical protein
MSDITNTSNVVTSTSEIDYDARDEFGHPMWIRSTGPKVNEKVRSQRQGMRSYRTSNEPTKAELRAAAEAAVASFPITKV